MKTEKINDTLDSLFNKVVSDSVLEMNSVIYGDGIGDTNLKITWWDKIKSWFFYKQYDLRHKIGEWIANDYFTDGDY